MNGQVRNVNERGFAFVRGEDDEDYFLHATQLVGIPFNELRAGDTVSFQPAEGPAGKGPIAVNAERVRRASGFSDDARRPEVEGEPSLGLRPTRAGDAATSDYDAADDTTEL